VSGYTTLATNQTPALIIYLLDVSASMVQPLGERRRIDVVSDALSMAFRQMVFRSTKGGRLSPRYRIAMFAYSDQVYDLLDGVRSIDEVVIRGVPELSPMRTTDTAAAFARTEQVLLSVMGRLHASPAPLVCHMTDGEYTGADPVPVVERIMRLSVPDGPVLVENIFISDKVLAGPVPDTAQWPGILPDTVLSSEYAEVLRRLSSPVPDSYRTMMREHRYQLAPGALMLFPGTSLELVALGFQMSAATPVR
jgi:hypothetical protein